MEQSSLKTNWKVAEVMCNQSYNEDRQRIELEGKKINQVSPCGKRIREKEQLHRDPSWEVSSLSHILATPTLGSNARKMSLLGWLEGWWAAPEGQKKARTLLMRHA